MPAPPTLSPDLGLPETIGRYEVRRLIGEGSMGRVLLAHDPVLDRDVAVKHLRHDLKIPRDVRDGLLTRMRHEARAAARVAHPNLVVLHDMGEDAAIGLYLVFEYIEGPTLKQRIAEGRLPAAEVARLARDLGAGLTVAHDAGILHRDVKPENVILAKTGAKIADFGIARIPDSTLTHQGGLMGTPAYSAPETFRAGKFSPESDQFSLAATLYEALSGQRAFPGDDAVSVAARIAHESPDTFAEAIGLPAAVDAVFARALARKAEERFASCTALGAALSDAITATVIVVEVEATAPIPGRASRSPLDRAAVGIDAAPALDAHAARSRDAAEVPTERKSGQVILGALVVVITATLLVRAALRSAERTPPEDPPPLPVPTHSASAATPRPRLTSSRPILPRSPPSAAPATSVEASPDAGAVAVPGASASAAASSAAPAPSASAPPIASAKNDAPRP
jgi:eukaryotic-like serine/threonine-protein kinase